MKITNIIIPCILCLLVSCQKEIIPTYNDCTSDRYIRFINPKTEADSLDISFFSYPGSATIDYPLMVQATNIGSKDSKYKISVIQEHTTAAASDFSLPAEMIMKEGEYQATCYLRLNYSEKLDTDKVRIVLQLEGTDDFLLGQTESRVAVIWFHNIPVKPDWWTSTVSSYILGTYTKEKYQEFMKVVKVDLSDADNSTIRYYALIFKDYLAEQKAKGTPVMEANGTEMTVPAV